MRATPKDVCLEDIAHALGNLCRFSGHCREFFSVAQHSVIVSRAVEGEAPEHALWGLLHDGAEAYIADLPSPVKRLAPRYRAVEEYVLGIIAQRFGLIWPMPEVVHRADMRARITEVRDLMGPPPRPWGIEAEPLPDVIVPVGPIAARRLFLIRAAEIIPGPLDEPAANAGDAMIGRLLRRERTRRNRD